LTCIYILYPLYLYNLHLEFSLATNDSEISI
jgi:hypothetical protein